MSDRLGGVPVDGGGVVKLFTGFEGRLGDGFVGGLSLLKNGKVSEFCKGFGLGLAYQKRSPGRPFCANCANCAFDQKGPKRFVYLGSAGQGAQHIH